jgi:archaellum component FlaG (FlaF/FlaG flagellin family)
MGALNLSATEGAKSMFKQFSKFVSALMITTLLATFGAGSVWAQETITDEAVPAIPTAGSLVRIEPGTWQWYTFRSQVPVNVEDDDDAVVTDPEDATIDITVDVQAGSVGFEVWSADDLNDWQNDVDFDPTGIGTENEYITNDPLFWQGSFETNDTYHLIVKNTGAEAAFYSLDITGHVSFPDSVGVATETTATEAMTEPVAVEPVATEAEATSNEISTGIPTGVVTIEPGTWQWYTFRSQVPVDAEEDDDAVVTDPEDATIDIALQVQSGSVAFEVWSAEDWNNWQNDVDFDPTGVGTENEYITNDPLFWQGSFQTNDTYHLIVKNTGTETASYSLDITGHVTFPVAQ